jgi:hypothetical protein
MTFFTKTMQAKSIQLLNGTAKLVLKGKLLQEQQCLFASVFVLFKRLKRGYISQKSGHSAH